MILNQIFSTASQIHRVPIFKFLPHLHQQVFRNAGAFWQCLRDAEDVVKDLFRQVLRLEAFHQMSNGVVGHVDGTVTQAFNEPLFIPWQLGAQAEGARAGPIAQPAHGMCQGILRGITEHLEIALHMFTHSFGPSFIAVFQIPLFAQSHHTFITRTGHHFGFWLEICYSFSLLDQLITNLRFHIGHLLSFVWPHIHDPRVEAFLIDVFLGSCQLIFLSVGSDLHLLTDGWS
mmetsp:Transcript_42780/g.93050  ORF Transcript_42780/g.93050 Transcript_42780/m.93050 type:complete len:231 (-) Transcript_42780:1261-1953(-)